MSNHEPISIGLDRTFLEHPRAFHIRRMRSAIWLYLVLIARLPKSAREVAADPAELGRAMGLPEGTIRSWLGHLRKHRYIELRRVGGALVATPKRVSRTAEAPAPEQSARYFTAAKLEHALGETGHRKLLEDALGSHLDPVIKRALAGTLAVPASEIRRSRTALFLYLIKHHAQTTPNNDPRH